MPVSQARSRSKTKRKQQLDKSLEAHYKTLGLKTLSAYMDWCAANGFSRRIKKTARERALEKAKLDNRKTGSKIQTASPYQGLSRGQLRDLLFQGTQIRPIDLPIELRTLADTIEKIQGGSKNRNLHTVESFQKLLEFCEGRKLRFVRMDRRNGGRGNSFLKALGWISKHRNCWIRDPDTFKSRSKNPHRLFIAFLRHLFVRFEMPMFMYSVWLPTSGQPDSNEVDMFLHLAAGHSIRRFDRFPIPLTKRMGHYFMHAPSPSLENAVRWSEIRGMGGSENLAIAVTQTILAGRYDNQKFWRTVFQWFVDHPMLDLQQVGPIIDFIQSQKFGGLRPIPGAEVPQPNFCMRGRTPQALVREVERWHGMLSRTDSRWINSTWAATSIQPFVLETGVTNKTTWSIQELLSTRELVEEGRKMKHCVSTYAASCVHRTTSIWSLQRADSEGRKRMLTIEVRPDSKMIVQIRGKNNRFPTEEEMKIISRWAQKANLRCVKTVGG